MKKASKKIFLLILFLFFISIRSIYAESQEYLNCVCKCACMAAGKNCASVTCKYDDEDYAGSPSCADPANGKCKCEGWGCHRTQFDETTECAQKCAIPNCASNEAPNAGNVCVCATNDCCTSKYGESYYDSSYLSTEEDTCRPKEGAVWDANLQKFVYPPCGGDYTRHSNGTCICGSESCCNRLFGSNSIWNGDADDGCGCAGSSVWTGSKCLCQHDSCCQALWGDSIYDATETDSGCRCMPGAKVEHGLCVCGADYISSFEQRTCICGDDGCCERIFGAAHYEYNAPDGCACNSNADWDGTKCLISTNPTQNPIETDTPQTNTPSLTPPEECPQNMFRHPESDKCVYKDDQACKEALGAAKFDNSPNNGCTCIEGATKNGPKCKCEDNTNFNPNTNKCEKAIIGKVLHLDGTAFSNVEILIKIADEKFTGTTDEKGIYTIPTNGMHGHGKISATKQGYIRSIIDFDTSVPVQDIILASVEDYEEEIRKNIKQFLQAGNISGAETISRKLKFSYESTGAFYYQSSTVFMPGEEYWYNPHWETIYHELGHFLMDELAYDAGADIGYEHDILKESNLDTAYDEGRAHFIMILISNYLKKQDTFAKLNSIPTFSYNLSNYNGELIEGVITRFWLDYYGANVRANSPGVFKNLLTVNNAYHNEFDFSRYPRNIIEWMEGKAVQIWNNKNSADYTKVLEYNYLLRKASQHNFRNDFPYIVIDENTVISYNPAKRVGIVFAGKAHFFGGRVEEVMNAEGSIVILPHSDFVIKAFENGTLNVYLKEGKLEIKDNNQNEIGAVLPENGFKKITKNSVKDLNENEKKELKKPMEISTDKYTPKIEFEESASNFSSNLTSGSWGFWNYVLLCTGSFVLILGLGLFVFLIRKKSKVNKLIPILIIIFSLCIGCSLSSLAIFNWLTYPSQKKVQELNNKNKSLETNIPKETEKILKNKTKEPTITQSQEIIADPKVMGFIENEDYKFSVFLGEFAPDVQLKKTTPDGVLASYDYCIPVFDKIQEDFNCGKGMYGLFNITVMNDAQYKQEILDSPMGDLYTTLQKKSGENIVFSHPNGIPPQDISLPDNFYEEVVDSFIKIN